LWVTVMDVSPAAVLVNTASSPEKTGPIRSVQPAAAWVIGPWTITTSSVPVPAVNPNAMVWLVVALRGATP
jgi:hypothetical protein